MELICWGHTTQNENWQVKADHAPGYIRVYQLDSGTVYYEDSIQAVTLQKDIIYLLPSHNTFRLTKEPGSVFRCLWLHVNLYPLLLQTIHSINPHHLTGAYELFSYMKSVIGGEANPEYILSRCLEIFFYQCQQKGFLNPPRLLSGRIAGLLEQEPGMHLSVAKLAEAEGYTAEHYIRLMKKECGMTPYQLIVNFRMAKACSFLREGFSITQVAELTGYHDIKTFERAFKKCYGRTASEYQKNYKSFFNLLSIE